MKKNLLFTLSLLCTAILVNAQVELTTFRGAFAPAPTPMWTDSWTNWDPQNAVYPAANVTVTGTISANTTWTSNNVYKISGLVYVDTLVTLTIQPGTIIRGDETVANSSLIITRGGKIDAQGTVCNPIVFTSNKAIGARGLADWGGLSCWVMQGTTRAPIHLLKDWCKQLTRTHMVVQMMTIIPEP